MPPTLALVDAAYVDATDADADGAYVDTARAEWTASTSQSYQKFIEVNLAQTEA